MKQLISLLLVLIFMSACGGGGGIGGIDTVQGVKDFINDITNSGSSSSSWSNQQLSNDAWKLSPNEAPKIAINVNGARYTSYTVTDTVYVGDTKSLSIDYLSNSQAPTITPASIKGLTNIGFDSSSKKLTITAIKDGNETIDVTIKDNNGTSKATIQLEIKKLPSSSTSSSTSSGISIDTELPIEEGAKPRIAIRDGFGSLYEGTYLIPGKLSIGQSVTLDFSFSSNTVAPTIKATSASKLANAGVDTKNKKLTLSAIKDGSETVDLTITDKYGSATVSVKFTIPSGASSSNGASSSSGISSSSGVSSSGGASSSSSSVDLSAYLLPSTFKQKTDIDINEICISDETKVQTVGDGLIMQVTNGIIIQNDKEVGDSINLKKDDTIKIKLTTGAEYFKEYNASAAIGNRIYQFSCKTKFVRITEPSDFTLISIPNAKVATEYESNEVTVSGITVSIQASIDNGTLIKNGVKQSTKNVAVSAGDKLKIALASSKNNEDTVSSTLTMGTKSSKFEITTEQTALNIILENQRYGANRDVNLKIRDYIKSNYSNDTVTCEISGSVPTGLNVDGANCAITGKTGAIAEKQSIKIVSKSQAGNISVEKSIDIEVSTAKSTIYKTGQTQEYTPGDDGTYSNKLGVPLGYTAQFGFVKDLSSSLEWQDNESKSMSVSEGLDYCLNLKAYTGDLGGWRMPTQEELETINNPVAKSFFTKKAEGYYWSNTKYAGNKSNYWYIDYKNGGKSYYLIGTASNYIRCVRGEKK